MRVPHEPCCFQTIWSRIYRWSRLPGFRPTELYSLFLDNKWECLFPALIDDTVLSGPVTEIWAPNTLMLWGGPPSPMQGLVQKSLLMLWPCVLQFSSCILPGYWALFLKPVFLWRKKCKELALFCVQGRDGVGGGGGKGAFLWSSANPQWQVLAPFSKRWNTIPTLLPNRSLATYLYWFFCIKKNSNWGGMGAGVLWRYNVIIHRRGFKL